MPKKTDLGSKKVPNEFDLILNLYSITVNEI